MMIAPFVLPQPAPAAEAAGFGPVRLGMSFEAVRAKTPQIEWRRLAASNLYMSFGQVQIGASPFTLLVTVEPAGISAINATQMNHGEDPDQCLRTLKTLAPRLEAELGPLFARISPLQPKERIHRSGGRFYSDPMGFSGHGGAGSLYDPVLDR
jgi:hypothetical protein